MNFQNLNQIKEKFDLESDDISEIKKQLLEILKQIHPDNNGGNFNSDNEKEKFNLLTEALDFLKDINKQESLIQLDKDNELTKFNDNYYLVQIKKEERINRQKDELRIISKASSKSNYFFPRLSSGIFFSICGLIITFSGQLQTHPLFSQMLNYGTISQKAYINVLEKEALENLRQKEFKEFKDKMIDEEVKSIIDERTISKTRKQIEPDRNLEYLKNQVEEANEIKLGAKKDEIYNKDYNEELRSRKPEMLESYNEYVNSISKERLKYFLIILIFLFVYSGFLFIITWIQERKDEAKSEWLLSDEGLRYVFQQFAIERRIQEQQTEVQFNRRDLESQIKKFYENRSKFRLPFQSKPQVNSSFTEKTAKFYIEEMTNRNLVKVIKTPKFDVTQSGIILTACF